MIIFTGQIQPGMYLGKFILSLLGLVACYHYQRRLLSGTLFILFCILSLSHFPTSSNYLYSNMTQGAACFNLL